MSLVDGKTSYYPAFDYLRIVLAVVVAMGHSGLSPWEQSGGLSVQIFFAMSGWLIGSILLDTAPALLPRFYYNRATRIWIPYFLAIGLLVCASLLKESVTSKWVEFIAYKVTFVYDFFGPVQLAEFSHAMPLNGTGNHFWSICAEEQFYLIAPIFVALIPMGRTIWFWLAVSLVALISPYWEFFGAISLGMLSAVIASKVGNWHSSQVTSLLLFASALILLVALVAGVVNFRIGSPFLSIALVLSLAQDGPRSRIASFFGGVSYPMYLNHWLGVFIANALFLQIGMKGSVISRIFSVLIALALAMILYVAVDRNVMRTRATFFTPIRGKLLALCGYVLVLIGMALGLNYRLAAI